VPAFQPIRLPGPPSEPDVRVGPASGSPHAHASRSGRIACPLVQLGLDIQYPQPSRISGRPRIVGIHRRTPDIPGPHCGHAVPLRHVTGFPGLGLLRGLRPIPRPSTDDESARRRPGRTAGRAIRDGSHVHPLTDRRVRRPTVPLQPRHEYAADFPRGLPTGPPNRLRSRPRQMKSRTCTAVRPISARFEPVLDLRGFHRWFLHTYAFPSCLPNPARLAVPNRPGFDGAASHPHLRHQDQAAPCFNDLLRQAESGSFHPTRSVGASWRTGGLMYVPGH